MNQVHDRHCEENSEACGCESRAMLLEPLKWFVEWADTHALPPMSPMFAVKIEEAKMLLRLYLDPKRSR